MRACVGSLSTSNYEGLVIDFDKDSHAKRASARSREARDAPFFCALCRMPVMYASAGARVDELPTRRTDGAYVLAETPEGGGGQGAGGSVAGTVTATGGAQRLSLVQCLAKPGEVIALRRADGRIEKQHTLLCPSCGVRVAYRSAPRPAPSPYTYIYAGALTHTPRNDIPVAAVKAEAAAATMRAVKRARAEEAVGDSLKQDAIGAAGENEAQVTSTQGGEQADGDDNGDNGAAVPGLTSAGTAITESAPAPTTFATARLAARFASVTGRSTATIQ